MDGWHCKAGIPRRETRRVSGLGEPIGRALVCEPSRSNGAPSLLQILLGRACPCQTKPTFNIQFCYGSGVSSTFLYFRKV